MKYLFLILISLQALADVKTCKDFVDNVLLPPISLDENSSDDGYRFIEDEKSALEFIKKYDVSKLQLKDELKAAHSEMNDCKAFNNPKKNDRYCNFIFSNFNFLRALLHANKHYNWQSSSKNLALNNVKAWLNESTTPGVPLIHLAISYSLLEDMTSSASVKAERAELEKAIQKRQEEGKKNKATDCVSMQKEMKKEITLAEPFRAKLAARLKESKNE